MRVSGISIFEEITRNRWHPGAVNKVVIGRCARRECGHGVESAVLWTPTATTCRNDDPTGTYGSGAVATFWSQLEAGLQLGTQTPAGWGQLQGLAVARILNQG